MSTRVASRRLVENLPISRPSQYICHACRQTTHISQQRRYASDELDRPETFLEKTRKKLWKGQPPGPENIDDVYGGPGVLAEMKNQRNERRKQQRREAKAAIPVEERYVPHPRISEITDEESVFRKPAATQAEFIERARDNQSGLIASPHSSDLDGDEEAEFAPAKLAADVRSWEGLEVIGHQGAWREMPHSRVDEYTPWQKMDKELRWTKNELISLMAIAAEEGQLVEATYFPGDADLSQLSEEAKATLLSQPLRFEPGSSTLTLLTRFSYLVRRRIPDPILTKISRKSTNPTIRDFLEMFDEKTKPKPTKVAEILMKNERLGEHGNLLVFGRKEGMIDKEQEIGRWKVIEAELKDRGLPIPGQPMPRGDPGAQ